MTFTSTCLALMASNKSTVSLAGLNWPGFSGFFDGSAADAKEPAPKIAPHNNHSPAQIPQRRNIEKPPQRGRAADRTSAAAASESSRGANRNGNEKRETKREN